MLSLPIELILQIADNISSADLNALARTHPRFFTTLNNTLYRRVLGDLYLPPAVLINISSHLSVSDHQHLILCGRFFHYHLDAALYRRSYQIFYIRDSTNPDAVVIYPVEKRGQNSPIWRALKSSRISTLEKMLAAGAPVDVRSSVLGPTLLEEAAIYSTLKIVNLLVKYGDIQLGWFESCESPIRREWLRSEFEAKLCLHTLKMRRASYEARLKSYKKMMEPTSHW
ncbi:hypothetical protein BDD12DRAFT_881446 [Trichophaea hybrida]|nr:hypothetical protein BDD12DRAFT_881446 [Trichophaea hybrida]